MRKGLRQLSVRLLSGFTAVAQQSISAAIASIVLIAPLTASLFAQTASAPGDGELKLVVALFRHGVRAPLDGFTDEIANKHSPNNKWPRLADWKVMKDDHGEPGDWGDLTIQGQKLAEALGEYYAKHYKNQAAWPNGFKAFLWADAEDQRTRETAKALRNGLRKPDIDVTVNSLQPAGTVDLLFHPFKVGCGIPVVARSKESPDTLEGITDYINRNWSLWTNRYSVRFNQFYGVLGCGNAAGCWFKTDDKATNWTTDKERKSPITGEERFGYASSATEAFLLEYANGMPVGWGKVDTPALRTMPFLHEFYFDQTERRRYLGQIQGSNLIKEIFNVINRAAHQPFGGCPHATADSQFIGLIGHDTNLASVGPLLGLTWQFNDIRLPDDTKGLPDNDALPAGALVFELRQREGEYLVRVEYVSRSLSQMRNGPANDAFRLAVRGVRCGYLAHCEMSLATFNKSVDRALGKDNEFLSKCTKDGERFCGVLGPAVK